MPFEPHASFVSQVINSRQVYSKHGHRDVRDTGKRTKAVGRAVGFRSIAAAPLLRNGEGIGAICINSRMPAIRLQKQIDLLKTFADQAVIAIENTRLFEEVQARTRELESALERQTATSEILGVISSSPGKLEPVFDAILKSARDLCGAHFGHLLLFDGQSWRPAALQNLPKAYADFWNRAPVVAGSQTVIGNLNTTKRPFQLLTRNWARAIARGHHLPLPPWSWVALARCSACPW